MFNHVVLCCCAPLLNYLVEIVMFNLCCCALLLNYLVEIVMFNLCCCFCRIWFNERFYYFLCFEHSL